MRVLLVLLPSPCVRVLCSRYSNRTAKGTAVADEPQSQYAVFAGRHYNDGCCFDYGNAENDLPDGKANVMGDGTMEAVSSSPRRVVPALSR